MGPRWRCWCAPAAPSIPPLRRALGAAGVPVEVARDELPLVRDPAVLPLLDALRAVVNLDNDDAEHADYVDPARAEALLLGPLGGLDAGDVRRLARLLRAREKDARAAPRRGRRCRPASWSARRCVDATASSTGSPAPRSPRRGAPAPRCWPAPAAELAAGGTAEEVLWALWSGTAWPQRLRRVGRARRRRGPPGPPRPRLASCALFDVAAARPRSSRDHAGVRDFLATPASPSRSPPTRWPSGASAAPPSGCSPPTGPRAWSGAWSSSPTSSRTAGPTCAAARPCSRPTGSARTSWSRRSRARELLRRSAACSTSPAPAPGSAWSSPPSRRAEDDGEQPSRLPRRARRRRSSTVDGRPGAAAVAGRAWSASCGAPSPTPTPPTPLRDAAARRLARLAGESVGERAAGAAGRPVDLVGHPRGDPVGASRSATPTSRCRSRPAMLESVMVCPTQWFLETEAGGRRARPPVGQPRPARARPRRAGRHRRARAGPGTLDAADGPRRRGLGPARTSAPPGPATASTSGSRVALTRFLDWHARQPAHAARHRGSGSRTVVELADGEQVALTGYADRLELDADGRVVVVDLKTGRRRAERASRSSGTSSSALYQYAVDNGAVDDLAPGRADGRSPAAPSWCSSASPTTARRRGAAAAGAAPTTAPSAPRCATSSARAASLLRAEAFPAVAGDHCRDCDFVPLCPIKGAGSVTSPVIDDRSHARGAPGALMGADFAPSPQQWAAITRAARAGGGDRRRRVRQDHADGGPGGLPRATGQVRPDRCSA